MSQQAERALVLLSARRGGTRDERLVPPGAALSDPRPEERRKLLKNVLCAFAEAPTSAEPELQFGLLAAGG